MYLSKNWWFPGEETKKTFLSGKSGKIGHVAVNQLGIFQLRENNGKNTKMYNHLPHKPHKDILKLMGERGGRRFRADPVVITYLRQIQFLQYIFMQDIK